MGGISKRRSHIEVEMHLSSRFKLFFLSSQQPKKPCQNSVWYFQFSKQLFGSLRTCIPFVWALAFTVSPSPSIDSWGTVIRKKTATWGAGFDPAKTIPVMIDVGCSDANGNSAKSGSQQITDAGGFCCFFFVCVCDAWGFFAFCSLVLRRKFLQYHTDAGCDIWTTCINQRYVAMIAQHMFGSCGCRLWRLTIRDHLLYHGLKDNRQKHTSKSGTEAWLY